jgi:transposase
MPFPKKRSPLHFSERDRLKLESIRKSRTAQKRRSLRAAFLLDSLAGQSDEAIARHHHVSRSTVVLCIQKVLQFGLDAALGELPRSGKPRQLTDDAIAWVQDCACQKPKELGYAYELWTYRLLLVHIRQHCLAAGHPVLLKPRGTPQNRPMRDTSKPANGTVAGQPLLYLAGGSSGKTFPCNWRLHITNRTWAEDPAPQRCVGAAKNRHAPLRNVVNRERARADVSDHQET